jgi:hypothetical protein
MLHIRRLVGVRIWERSSRRMRRRRGERWHGRRAREGRLTRAAGGVCSWRRALSIAALLYPQGPDWGDDGRLWVVVSQEELLVGTTLLPPVHDGVCMRVCVFAAPFLMIAGDDRRPQLTYFWLRACAGAVGNVYWWGRSGSWHMTRTTPWTA